MNDKPSGAVPVAIIGIGCMFPKAPDLRAYWANILGRVDAITEVPPTHWRPEDYFDKDPKTADRTYAVRGGFLSPVPFPPLEFGVTPNSLEAIDTAQLLGLVVARQALEDAGYGSERSFDRTRVSVVLGVTGTLELVIPLGARLGHPIWRRALEEAGVDGTTADDVVRRISSGYVSWQEDSFPGLLGNVVAGRIANRLDLGGTNCVVDAACASSLSALHLAMLELASGRCDMALSGGIDTFNDIFMYMCFSKTPALSPTGNARPFDAGADGTILGEGLGCVLLKRLEDAERDGDTIYAVIRGLGTSSDGKGQAIYAPSPAGQMKALRQAYGLAGITPDTIDLVEAHGTGTRAGDVAEVTALSEVYRASGKEGSWCALGSVKSQIGHTKAAAGAAGLIKAALALYHKVLPPTIKVGEPIGPVAPEQSPFYVNTEKRPWLPRSGQPRRAAVSAFGFGGSNFHCVLEEYGSDKRAIDWDGRVQIAAFSSDRLEDLQSTFAGWCRERSWEELCSDATQTRAAFRPTAAHRLVLVLEQGQDLGKLLSHAQALWAKQPRQSSWTTPEGLYFASGPAAGKLAFLFPGQGSQYVGMLRDLACQFPQVQQALAEADVCFAEVSGPRLSDRIYPQPAFTEEVRRQHDEALKATEVAQPALGAVSLGALRVLEYFGVRPEAAAGHSFGELTALCAAGRFGATELHALSRLRGRLMAEGSGDRGGMLAVRAPLDRVQSLLQSERLDLVVANRNAPTQAVLSGSSAEIGRARSVLETQGIDSKQLAVSAAFHSRFVGPVREPFRAALEEVEFRPGSVPVFANTTAREYPVDPRQARQLLAGQLAEPVDFVTEVENLYRWGVRTFLEVGPGNKLTALVRSILQDRPHEAAALDTSGGKRCNTVDLARVLAQLAALGRPVRLDLWEKTDRADTALKPAKPGLRVPLCGANYVAARHKPGNGAAPQVALPVRKPEPPRPHKEAREQMSGPSVAEDKNGTMQNGHVPKVAASPSPVVAVPLPAAIKPATGARVRDAVSTTQDNLLALQRLSEQTAQLHRQFLDGQDKALQVFQSLLEQQQALLQGRLEVGALPVVAGGSPAPDAPQASRLQLREETPASLGVPTPTLPEGPATTTGEVAKSVLGIVSEKTGYPSEMLDLDMELDADLGIDSIKRVEIFAALQEKLPHAPAVKSEHLGTLRTLRDVVVFLEPSNGITAEPESPVVLEQQPVVAAPPPDSSVQPLLLAVVAEKTGYPPEMLELDMELDADLGIDSIKRVEIFATLQERLPHAPAIKSEHLGTLRTLRNVLDFLGVSAERQTATETVSTPTPPAVSAVSLSQPSQDLRPVLLATVSDKTGYPPEMLELDMELDADLGIDSIKRVEIFAALQEKLPGAPAVKSEHLGSLRTLRHVLEFLSPKADVPASRERERPEERQTPPPIADAPGSPEDAEDLVQRLVLTAVPLDEGVGRAAISVPTTAEIWVLNDRTELAERVNQRLNLLGYRLRMVAPADLPRLACPDHLAGLVLLAPARDAGDHFLVKSFKLLQLAAPALRRCGTEGGAVFVTVSRLDGCFGLAGLDAAADPLPGGLAGLAKTAAQEWPEVHCKALDLAPDSDAEEAALAIVAEMFLTGPLEVGLSAEGASSLRLTEVPLQKSGGAAPLRRGDVVLVTGGARGVTAAAAVALARTFAPTLVLLGRSSAPTAEPAWLAPLSDEAEIKRALLAQAGGKASPKEIGERCRLALANREVLGTLEQIERTGARVLYRQVDVRDAQAVRSALAEIRGHAGPVRGLVDGAGVLADRRIEDKTQEQFELVYGTKVTGLRALLAALPADELKMLTLFSSSTARFGRTGQVDYAVANEVLNKIAQQEARRRPGCRVVSLNWGPWDGGMVTPSLKKFFENEGIGLIPLAAGADYLVRELSQSTDRAVEIVVLGKPLREGEAPAKPADLSVRETINQKEPASIAPLELAFERELTVERYPFLRSHVINGHAVLPLAMILEWLAQGALHGQPGLTFQGLNDLRVCKGVVIEEGQALPLAVLTGRMVKRDAAYLIPVELRSRDGRDLLHARAEVVLGTTAARAGQPGPPPLLRPYRYRPAEIYSELLFHGPDLQGLQLVEGCSEAGIAAGVSCAPPPSAWVKQPLRQTWLSDPLVLDCCFQLMILWTLERHGAPSLPCFAGSYRQYRRSGPRDGARVVVRVSRNGPQSVLADIDVLDRQGGLLAQVQGCEHVIDRSLNEAFRRNQLVCGALPAK